MSAPRSNPRLSGHQEALSDYLDSLLQEVPDYLPDDEPAEPETPPVLDTPVIERLPVMPLPPVQAPTAEPGPEIAAPVEAPAVEAETVVETPVETAPPPAEAPVPSWAEQPFPCLLFTIDGLNLAVPLVHLNGILPWRDDLTPMPNHQAWFLGIGRNHGVNTKVVDTALVVVPPERRAAGLGERKPFGNVILIGESHWGLACTAVGEMVTLRPGDVRWRSSRGQRPWLAGTVIKEMCALLDTEALAEMLSEGV
jgi:purine-binding chemotaxis protein CheW